VYHFLPVCSSATFPLTSPRTKKQPITDSRSFLVVACPNVVTLALEYSPDHDDLVHAAADLKKLKHAKICRDNWRNQDI
jgi:hypothetical protein